MKRSLPVLLLACLVASPVAAEEPCVASGTRGVVVSADVHATRAGVDVLRRGGTAVDAAIAVGFALAVTFPEAGTLGGGGFMLVREPKGRAQVIDYRETAPAAAHPKLFLNPDGAIDPIRVRLGYVSAGIPGTVAGLGRAHALYGKRPWKELLQPAIRLATQGFVVDERLASGLARRSAELGRFPSTRAVFFRGEQPIAAGQRLVQPDLARVLVTIAEKGPDSFYRGPLAERMASKMKAVGGIWTSADLASYRARVRAPVRYDFSGHTLISVPPPSSGGVALAQMLGILSGFDLAKRAPRSAQTLHLVSEAMRRAFLQRALHLGDADHVTVDMAGLLSADRITGLRASIDPRRASDSRALAPKGLVEEPAKGGDTTHFGVIDGSGMAVANTTTIEESYGSKAVLGGFGFLLNNELHDFNVKPGSTTDRGRIGTPPNRIAPGKRPLSSMSPSMIERDGRVVAILGSPGGRTIINTVLQVALNLTVFGLAPQKAVAAPRIHHQWMPDRIFAEPHLPVATIEGLRALGHRVDVHSRTIGHANTLAWDAARRHWVGVCDARYGGHAAAR